MRDRTIQLCFLQQCLLLTLDAAAAAAPACVGLQLCVRCWC
jgi:hypothetical protein